MLRQCKRIMSALGHSGRWLEPLACWLFCLHTVRMACRSPKFAAFVCCHLVFSPVWLATALTAYDSWRERTG
eukprot:scaffold12514_cov19-Prasinocladus_malaysianus.AAC.1